MDEISEIVIKCHNEILKESNIDKVSSLDMELTRENGISSLGIVSLIVAIEDKLQIDLDDYLILIRECKKISELIEVIKNALQ